MKVKREEKERERERPGDVERLKAERWMRHRKEAPHGEGRARDREGGGLKADEKCDGGMLAREGNKRQKTWGCVFERERERKRARPQVKWKCSGEEAEWWSMLVAL